MAGAFLPEQATPGNEPVSLQWRPTEIGGDIIDDDFVAQDGEARIGRVHTAETRFLGRAWAWFAWFPVMPHSGHEPSRREAMMAVEDRYSAWRAKR